MPDTRSHALRGWVLLAYAMVPVALMAASTAYHLTRPGGGSLISLQERAFELAVTFVLLVLIPLDVGGSVRRGLLAKFPGRGQVAFLAGFVLTAAAFIVVASWPLIFLLLGIAAIAGRRSSAYAATKAELGRYSLLIATADGIERDVLLKLRRGLMMKWRDSEKMDAFNAVIQFVLISAVVFGLGWMWADISERFERSSTGRRAPAEIHQGS